MSQSSDLLQEIKIILDITSRVDERVKLIQSNQQDLNHRVNDFLSEFNELSSRVSVIESKSGGNLHLLEQTINEMKIKIENIDIGGTKSSYKTQEELDDLESDISDIKNRIAKIDEKVGRLQDHKNSWEDKANKYFNFITQGVWVIIVCYVLYKLGLQSPPIP